MVKVELKRRGFALLLAALVLAGAGQAAASEITAENIIKLTNGSRKEAGLRALSPNQLLTLAAQGKAEDMFTNQYFEHISPDGVTPWYWIKEVGYDYIYAAENLAIDFVTAEGAHNALMKSPGHRQNILCANYKDIGVAVLSGLFGEKISIIIVEEFGALREKDRTEEFFEKPASSQSAVQVVEVQQPLPLPAAAAESVPASLSEPQPELEEATVGEGEPAARTAVPTEHPSDLSGRIVTLAYGLDMNRSLKKVYVENIYWKRDSGDSQLISALQSNRARLKLVLRKLTGNRCCSGIDK